MKSEQGLTLAGVRLETDVPAPMRDGTILRADVYRPLPEGNYPVLLLRIPYGKIIAQSITYQHPSWYARHGYVVVVQDCRGRYRSEGLFDPLRNEALDGYDSIEWAAKLPESNGRVGMYGFSYSGAAQLLAAAEQPPSLRCCAPAFTASDYYDGWFYEKGAFNLAFVVSWVVQMLAVSEAIGLNERKVAESILSRIHDFPALYRERPLSEFSLFRGTLVAQYFFEWLRHDTRDEYWEEIELESRYDAVRVPCLHIGGWYDIFSPGTVRNFQELTRRRGNEEAFEQHLLMGPWMHIPWSSLVGAKDFGALSANIVDDAQLRWFDRWLKSADGRTSKAAPVTLFVGGEDTWYETSTWPAADMRMEDWFLHSDGRANSRSGDGVLSQEPPSFGEPPDVFVYDPGNPPPSAGGRSCCNAVVAPMGPSPQELVEIRNDVLVYTSDELIDTLRVIGNVRLHLFASTSAVDTDWVARLVDVGTSGETLNICQGIVRARFRDSLASPTCLDPGVVYEYNIELGPIAWAFESGHRLRLQVTSGDFPSHDANSNKGLPVGAVGVLDAVVATQMVFHEDKLLSRIRLPAVRT